jgi:hypothetical protein
VAAENPLDSAEHSRDHQLRAKNGGERARSTAITGFKPRMPKNPRREKSP